MSNITIAYDYLMRLVGLPYRWGGDDPIDGFDCSGLVLEFLKSQGLVAGHDDLTAQGLAAKFHASPATAPQFGTLLFYGDTIKSITHVTLALSETLMIEAGGGGSATKTREDAARQNAFVRIRPIAGRKGLVAVRHPNYAWSQS